MRSIAKNSSHIFKQASAYAAEGVENGVFDAIGSRGDPIEQAPSARSQQHRSGGSLEARRRPTREDVPLQRLNQNFKMLWCALWQDESRLLRNVNANTDVCCLQPPWQALSQESGDE